MKCSFCGRSRLEVRQLVAGPSVYICDQCTHLCVEAIGGAQSDPMDALVQTLLDKLLAIAAADDVTAIVEAAMRLAQGRSAALDRIAHAAIAARRPDLALRAVQATPEAQRDFRWAQMCCVAHYQCGNYASALSVLQAADPTGADPNDLLRHRLNKLTCTLRAEQDAQTARLVSLLRDLTVVGDEVRSAFGESDRTWREAQEARAQCLLQLGKPSQAIGILDQLAGQDWATKLTFEGQLLLGDCHAKLDRTAEAHTVWTAVRDTAAPGLRVHHDAVERLAGGATPYR